MLLRLKNSTQGNCSALSHRAVRCEMNECRKISTKLENAFKETEYEKISTLSET